MGCCYSSPSTPVPRPFFAVGPVVGAVDESSARILIETFEQSQIEVTVFEAPTAKGPFGLHPITTFNQTVQSGGPVVIVVNKLKPGLAYRVTLKGQTFATAQTTEEAPASDLKNHSGAAVASFSTIQLSGGPGAKAGVRMGFVSCNNFLFADRSQLWRRLLEEVKTKGLDYLVHMGDQVYADGELYKLEKKKYKTEEEAKAIARNSVWEQSRALLSQAGGSNPAAWEPYRAQVCELFRGVYRKTWTAPDVAAVLASVPNVMVLDDHELRDDFGDRPEDLVRESMESFLATCGLQVYHEYQTQLHRDLNVRDVKEKAYSSHVVAGKVGLFLLDLRVERSLHKTMHDKGVDGDCEWAKIQGFMGPRQHRDLDAALDLQFKDVSQLFLVSPTPLVLLSEHLTMFLSTKVDDLKGTWTAKPFIEERDVLLRKLVKWTDQAPHRSVALVAGDIHIGGHSEITLRAEDKKRRYTIHQLTSSAVAGDFFDQQEMSKAFATLAMKVDADVTSAGNDDIKFKHSRYQHINNASIIETTRLGDPSARPSVQSKLLLGNGSHSKTYNLSMRVVEPSRCSVM